MWIPKTTEESRAAAKARRAGRIALVAIGAGGLLYLAATAGVWHGQDLGIATLPLKPLVPGVVSQAVATALVLAALFLLFRKRTGTYVNTVICPTCNRIKTEDGNRQCVCGGAFRGMIEMKWVDGTDKPALAKNPDGKDAARTLAAVL